MKLKGVLRLAGGAVVAVVIGGALVAVGAHALRPEVSVATVERGDAVDAVPGVVQVAAERTFELRTETGGVISDSILEIGEKVSAEDVLVRLDDAELDRAIERLRFDLEAEKKLDEVGSLLRFDLEEAEEELARMEELYQDGETSRRELDAQARRVARIGAEKRREEIEKRRRLQRLKSELKDLEEERERMFLRAPVDGRVMDIYAHPGDLLGPRSSIARILSDDRVVEATLSEENFAGVEPGQPATVRFLGYGRRTFPAEVKKVLPAADPETQRYTVHLDVDMPENMMVPGITGEVSIVLDQRTEALVVPRRALMGNEVFVLREGHAVLHEVERGFTSLNQVEILNGLREGDRVIVENLDRLRDGDRVRVRRP